MDGGRKATRDHFRYSLIGASPMVRIRMSSLKNKIHSIVSVSHAVLLVSKIHALVRPGQCSDVRRALMHASSPPNPHSAFTFKKSMISKMSRPHRHRHAVAARPYTLRHSHLVRSQRLYLRQTYTRFMA